MKVNGTPHRTIWLAADARAGIGDLEIIDQTKLPHEFITVRLTTVEEAGVAIKDMWVRGAPLIGATAAYGVALAMRTDPSDTHLAKAYDHLFNTRPTAVNLRWALDDMTRVLNALPPNQRITAAYRRAAEISNKDVAICASIGEHGKAIIEEAWNRKDRAGTVNVLTHCNAGWLATVDWGTALAPIYKAFDAGIQVHVWVDETRPRNQGASLTAWELGQHGVDHTVIVDSFQQTSDSVFTVFIPNPLENIVQAQLLTANLRVGSGTRIVHLSIDELNTNFSQRATKEVNGQAALQVLNRNFGSIINSSGTSGTTLYFKNEYPVMQQYINPIRKLDRLTITLREGDATGFTTSEDSFLVFRFVCKKRNLAVQ